LGTKYFATHIEKRINVHDEFKARFDRGISNKFDGEIPWAHPHSCVDGTGDLNPNPLVNKLGYHANQSIW